MSIYWKYRVSLSPELRDLFASIPGLRVNAHGVSAPRNVAWFVRETLQGLGVPFGETPGSDCKPRGAAAALPWLQPWVPEFLTQYQRDGIKAVLSLPGSSGTYWWSAGSGKSLGGLVWALSHGVATTIIVTKASIRGTWAREIDTYTRGVQWHILEGRQASGLPSWDPSRPCFFITGYDTLPDWIGLLESLRPGQVIFDEIHSVKSNKRWDAQVDLSGDAEIDGSIQPKVTFSLKDNRAAAAMLLSRAAKSRLGLTATPISDRVRDLWAQLDLIHPWEFGAFSKFAQRYCAAAENGFGGIDTRGRSNLPELKRRTDHVTHRVPFSVANRSLPSKRRLVTYVKVSEQVRAEGFAADLRSAMRGVNSSAEGRSRLAEMMLMEAAARKRKVVQSWVEDAVQGKQKVLVFTGRRRDCQRLSEDLTRSILKLGLDVPCPIWHGDGSTPMGDPRDPAPGTRTWMVDQYWKAPGPAVLIATGDAFGEGLNGMHDTDLQIMAMLPYTPRQIIQREGRVARLGQKRPVLIRYPICEGTIDERVCSILLDKLPAVEKATQSDEIEGLGRELIGASEEELLGSMLDKVLGEKP